MQLLRVKYTRCKRSPRKNFCYFPGTIGRSNDSHAITPEIVPEMVCAGVLTDISDTGMCIAHESMPFVIKFFGYFLSTILFEKVMNFLIRFSRIMCCLIIGCIVWYETVWPSDTDKTLFLFTNSGCPPRHIEISFWLPISRGRIRIITNSVRSCMVGKKSRHITDESVYIFMKYMITFSRIRIAEVDNMKMLKTIRT